MIRIRLFAVVLLFAAAPAHADPVASADVYVADGETIAVRSQRSRSTVHARPKPRERDCAITARTWLIPRLRAVLVPEAPAVVSV